jgi:hypothetical protein
MVLAHMRKPTDRASRNMPEVFWLRATDLFRRKTSPCSRQDQEAFLGAERR